MSWHLDRRPYKEFKRNPLEAVVAQLRFHPILKIDARVADFQDRVRDRFPAFVSASVKTIQFGVGEAQVSEEPQFQFRKLKEPAALVLTRESLALETKRHEKRAVLKDDMLLATQALEEAYQPVAPVRFGLRYINAVRLQRISKDINRPLQWSDLLSESFLRVPSNLADLADTFFSCEVKSTLTEGYLTLRYGLLPAPDTNEAHFRLDLDRFVEGQFDVRDVPSKLEAFSDDIFDVFMAAIGPALIEWMDRG